MVTVATTLGRAARESDPATALPAGASALAPPLVRPSTPAPSTSRETSTRSEFENAKENWRRSTDGAGSSCSAHESWTQEAGTSVRTSRREIIRRFNFHKQNHQGVSDYCQFYRSSGLFSIVLYRCKGGPPVFFLFEIFHIEVGDTCKMYSFHSA